MKHLIYVLMIALLVSHCNNHSTTPRVGIGADSTKQHIKLRTLPKKVVLGDFNGDGKQDTVIQGNCSKLTGTEIHQSPDPSKNEWDTVVQWFYRNEADVYLTIKHHPSDTLHLGAGQGLYCLINIGDNNADGKDEVALVLSNLDYSRVNSCEVFTLCKGTWTLIQEFHIHEGAFDTTTEKVPDSNHIQHFLERQNGQWKYKDYLADGYHEDDAICPMKPLALSRCQ